MGIDFGLGEVEAPGGRSKVSPCQWKTDSPVGEQGSEPGGRVGSWGRAGGGPADLSAVVAGIDASAESGGHELRAETDAEDGFLGLDRRADESDFFFEEGVVVVVVDRDGAAEDY